MVQNPLFVVNSYRSKVCAVIHFGSQCFTSDDLGIRCVLSMTSADRACPPLRSTPSTRCRMLRLWSLQKQVESSTQGPCVQVCPYRPLGASVRSAVKGAVSERGEATWGRRMGEGVLVSPLWGVSVRLLHSLFFGPFPKIIFNCEIDASLSLSLLFHYFPSPCLYELSSVSHPRLLGEWFNCSLSSSFNMHVSGRAVTDPSLPQKHQRPINYTKGWAISKGSQNTHRRNFPSHPGWWWHNAACFGHCLLFCSFAQLMWAQYGARDKPTQ